MVWNREILYWLRIRRSGVNYLLLKEYIYISWIEIINYMKWGKNDEIYKIK